MTFTSKIKAFTHNGIIGINKAADKYGPTVAIIGGVGLMIAGTVTACKQTLKAEEVLDQHRKRVQAIETAASDEIYKDQYTEEDAKKDVQKDLIKTGLEFVNLYKTPIILSISGVSCILWGTKKLNTKVKDLTIGTTALLKAIDEYRNRVAQEIGKEKEEEIFLNTEKKEIVDQETGEVKTIERFKDDRDVKNPYILTFGPFANQRPTDSPKRNPVYMENHPTLNLATVTQVEESSQRTLENNGKLYLFEVCKNLGIECPPELLGAGWVVKRREDGTLYAPVGDSKVSFRVIYDLTTQDWIDESNGMGDDREIILFPNCCDIQTYLYTSSKRIQAGKKEI